MKKHNHYYLILMNDIHQLIFGQYLKCFLILLDNFYLYYPPVLIDQTIFNINITWLVPNEKTFPYLFNINEWYPPDEIWIISEIFEIIYGVFTLS